MSGKAPARRSTCNSQRIPVAAKITAGVFAKEASRILLILKQPRRRARSIRYSITRGQSVEQSSAVMFIAASGSRTSRGLYVFADYLGP